MRTSNFPDTLPNPFWFLLVVLGFFSFWPIGVLALIYLFWSGKMHCCTPKLASSRYDASRRWQCFRSETQSTGNIAFDDYRRKKLKQLEEERRAFGEFLDNLRRAKDQEEFDRFLAERATRAASQKEDD